jgi:hypothetical protein
MNKMFRPMAMNKAAQVKARRLGDPENYNFPRRVKWYPAGWGFNKRVLGSIHSRMHYLACHAPDPIQKAWRAKYNVFMNKHFGDAGRGSMRYLNTWSCHSWM